MNVLQRATRLAKRLADDPVFRLEWLTVKGVYNGMSDADYLKKAYRIKTGKPLALDAPRTFNEKLQWLKVYNQVPAYTRMVDKYEVKQYIAQTIGEEYVIPALGVWDRFEEIDFDALPERFVLKCTHDSGGLVICRDKARLDMQEAQNKLSRSLRRNFYWAGREWPYKDVKPRILAEPYMEDAATGELRDYKFFCFDGVCRCFKVDFDRQTEHRANYFDPQGHLLPFGEAVCPPDHTRQIELPVQLERMLALAGQLSRGIPFVRVDFYEVNGAILFGELTFFPASGFGAFVPDEWDRRLGEWLTLPEK